MAGFVALPARYNPAAPEPRLEGRGVGGPRLGNYGAVSRDNPPPEPLLQDQLASGPDGALHYARPYYENSAGADTNSAVVNYSPGDSATFESTGPTVPVPVSRKRVDQGTIYRQFGVWSQDYPNGGRGVPPMKPQPSRRLAIGRMRAQPQIEGPYYPLLTQLAQASSYGQTTETLPATPFTESIYG